MAQTKAQLSSKRKQLQQQQVSAVMQSAMIGQYHHPHAGTVLIERKATGLQLSWGNLSGKVYSADPAQQFLVELRPGRFYPMTIAKDSASLQLKDWLFTKQQWV